MGLSHTFHLFNSEYETCKGKDINKSCTPCCMYVLICVLSKCYNIFSITDFISTFYTGSVHMIPDNLIKPGAPKIYVCCHINTSYTLKHACATGILIMASYLYSENSEEYLISWLPFWGSWWPLRKGFVNQACFQLPAEACQPLLCWRPHLQQVAAISKWHSRAEAQFLYKEQRDFSFSLPLVFFFLFSSIACSYVSLFPLSFLACFLLCVSVCLFYSGSHSLSVRLSISRTNARDVGRPWLTCKIP